MQVKKNTSFYSLFIIYIKKLIPNFGDKVTDYFINNMITLMLQSYNNFPLSIRHLQ